MAILGIKHIGLLLESAIEVGELELWVTVVEETIIGPRVSTPYIQRTALERSIDI